MIINATFTSVWDGGFLVTTKCKVNQETKEVFEIEESPDTADCVNCLDTEYITIDDVEYPVCQKDNIENGEYWYD